MVKVSVIIPIYNDEKYLQESLNFIINQTLDDIEIICVNDGSTDNSLDILNNFSKQYDFIKILNQENSGVGVARNNGMKIAEGEYVYFFDADDYIVPDALEILYNNAISNQSDFVIFKAGKFYDNGNYRFPVIGFLDDLLNQSDYNSLTFSPLDVKQKIFNDYYFAPWFKLYNRNFLRKNSLNFQDVSSYNDVFFHIRSFLKANTISYVPEYLYYYRIDNINSLTHDHSKHLNIFKVIDRVESFLNDENFIDDFKNEFDKIKLIQISNHMMVPVSLDYFRLAKKYFSKMDLTNNPLISNKELDKYDAVLNMSEIQIEDFKYYRDLYKSKRISKKKNSKNDVQLSNNYSNESFFNKLKNKITNKFLDQSNSFIFY